MVKFMTKITMTDEVKYLDAVMEVRYWEDAIVDGIVDEDGTLIPCREGDNWHIVVDVDTGQIINWKTGVTADIHYKICDAGVYSLLNVHKEVFIKKEGYVCQLLDPEHDGYGDYVIIHVDANGFIQGWNVKDMDWFGGEE